MNNPLVSIIIPTYNRAHLIGETLDSVLAQTYENWECIIVDDGSTDNTAEVINRYNQKDSRFQFYYRPIDKIKGASSCRNFGLSQSEGVFVIFLDSDDLLLEYCLQRRLEVVTHTSGLTHFWVFPMWIEHEDGFKQLVTIPKEKNYLFEFLNNKIHWGIMCTLWDSHFIKEMNGFNELYPRLNDPEVHIRAMLQACDHFVVCNDLEPDSVYKAAPIKDKNSFAINYEKSLYLFIPDIVRILYESQKSNLIILLKGYLNHYFINFHLYNYRENNIMIVKMFYKQNVISWKTYQKLKWFYYGKLVFLKLLKMNEARIRGILNS